MLVIYLFFNIVHLINVFREIGMSKLMWKSCTLGLAGIDFCHIDISLNNTMVKGITGQSGTGWGVGALWSEVCCILLLLFSNFIQLSHIFLFRKLGGVMFSEGWDWLRYFFHETIVLQSACCYNMHQIGQSCSEKKWGCTFYHNYYYYRLTHQHNLTV